MDCGLALCPLSCDVTGEAPTGQGREDDCGLRKAEEDRCAAPLAVGVLALAFTASSASAGKLQTGFLDPRRALTRGSVRDHAPAVSMPAVKVPARGSSASTSIGQTPRPRSRTTSPTRTTPTTTGTAVSRRTSTAALSNGLEVMLTIRSAPGWARARQGTPHAVPTIPIPVSEEVRERRGAALRRTCTSGASGTSRTTRPS